MVALGSPSRAPLRPPCYAALRPNVLRLHSAHAAEPHCGEHPFGGIYKSLSLHSAHAAEPHCGVQCVRKKSTGQTGCTRPTRPSPIAATTRSSASADLFLVALGPPSRAPLQRVVHRDHRLPQEDFTRPQSRAHWGGLLSLVQD